MRVKDIKEVFNDYKKTSMLISCISCDFKCENEGLCEIGSCQNSSLSKEKIIYIEDDKIIDIFKENIVVDSILFGGLEPFLQFEEVYNFIKLFRKNHDHDIVIFTGY